MTVSVKTHWDEAQVKLIREMYAKGLTDTEFETYALICQKAQLDPIGKQIYAIKRTTKINGKEEGVMTIQTSIDGYRIIAERTGKYAPGSDTVWIYGEKNELLGARVYVKKMTPDNTWHQMSAEAYMDEYKPKNAHWSSLWNKMPRVMIEKCAEARALRRAFPKEYMGIYIKEEMQQSELAEIEKKSETSDLISQEQAQEIRNLVGDKINILDRITTKYGISSILQIKQKDFDAIIKGIKIINQKGATHA